MSQLIYPHRVTFLNRGKCDVCQNKTKILINTNTNHFFGWESCNNDICNETIQKWHVDTTIPIDNLIERFGEEIYVLRSTGLKEAGWAIISDAYQEEKNGPFWVYVKDNGRHLTKEIQLLDLEKWNQPENQI